MSELQLSSKLQLLIDEANKFTKTWADKVLAVYDQAKIEGYTPQEARKLVEEKIFSVSSRHMRRILPTESKNQNMVRVSKPKQIADMRPQIPAREEKIIEVQPSEKDNPYEESQDKLDELIAQTQEQQLKPIQDIEDLQIQLNDAQTKLEQERTERIRIMQLLDKERERAKELESTKNPNFTPAIEMVPTQTKTDNETMPTAEHRKIIGQLNSRILELKDKLSEVSTYEEIIEIKNQKIVLVIEATNLKSVQLDEAKSRRLNQ